MEAFIEIQKLKQEITILQEKKEELLDERFELLQEIRKLRAAIKSVAQAAQKAIEESNDDRLAKLPFQNE